MELLKSKILFNNSTTKLQAISKLFKVIDHQLNIKIMSEKNEKTAECLLMWDCIASEDLLVSSTTCSLAYNRAVIGLIDYNYFCNKLENLSYTLKNLNGVVEALYLIILNKNKDKNICETKVSETILFKLIQTRPDAWFSIKNFYISTKINNKNFGDFFQVMKSLIRFILLGPNFKNKTYIQHSLFQSILETKELNNEDLIYTIHIFHWLQKESNDSNEEILHLIAVSLIALSAIETSAININLFVCNFIDMIAKFKLDSFLLFNDLLVILEKYSLQITCLNEIILSLSLILSFSFTSLSYVLQIADYILMLNKEKKILNRIVVSFLLLPLLQNFLIPSSVETPKTITLTHKLIKEVEEMIKNKTGSFEKITLIPECVSFQNVILSLIGSLCLDDNNIVVWLRSVINSKCNFSDVSYEIVCLVSGLLCLTKDEVVVQLCLNCLEKICLANSTMSLHMFSLMMYKLKSTTDPCLCKLLLTYWIKLSIHKMCFSQVQSLLLHLFENEKMSADALLLASSLWSIHSSTSPFLIDLISKTSDVDLKDQLAKMSTITLICEIAPEKHGEELLSYITSVFNNSKANSALVCLALKGLYHLCQSEIMDLKTTWKVVGAKISANKKYNVQCEMCNFLSLAAQFNFDNIDFQIFKRKLVNYLWQLSQDENVQVSLAAFQSLTNFSRDDIENITFEWTDEDIDGSMFATKAVELILNSSQESISGPESFVSMLVKHELENMPRNLSYNSNQQYATESSSNIISKLPDYINDLLESKDHEDIMPVICASQLFTLQMQVSVDKNGRPITSSVANCSQGYLKKLAQLLVVAAFESEKDIFLGCTILEAFHSFIKRTVTATHEARIIEIERLKHGRKIDVEEEADLKNCAILWVRDKIMDVIKNAKKDSINTQSNCLYALSGLARVVSARVAEMDSETLLRSNDVIIEHTKHSKWLEILSDSYFSILVPSTLTPQTRTLHFFKDFIRSNLIIKCVALLSFSSTVSVLSNYHLPIVQKFIDYLTDILASFENRQLSDLMVSYESLAAAYLINSFIVKGISQDNNEPIFASLKKLHLFLENMVLQKHAEQPGIILAFSMILTCSCLHGYNLSEHSQHSICTIMTENLKITNTNNIELKLFAFSSIAGSSYLMNQISVEQSNQYLNLIEELTEKNKSYLAMGNLLYFYLNANHLKAKDLSSTLYNNIIANSSNQIIIQEGIKYLAAFTGILGIITGISFEMNLSMIEKRQLDEIFKYYKKQVEDNSETACTCVILLASLYHLQVQSHSKITKLSSNYHYLPNSSLIRSLVDYLINTLKEEKIENKIFVLESVLKCLTCENKYALPPLNWPSITSPLLRLQIGHNIEFLTVKLLFNQSKFLVATAEYLISLLISPVFNVLHVKCKEFIFENMNVLAVSCPAVKVKLFISQTMLNEGNSNFNQFVNSYLSGFKDILTKKTADNQMMSFIYSCLHKIYNLYKINHILLFECLSLVPDTVVDEIVSDKNKDADDILRTFRTRCLLIGSASQPLDLLCNSIEKALSEIHIINKDMSYVSCLKAFSSVSNMNQLPKFLNNENQTRWLLNLITFIKHFTKNISFSLEEFEYLFVIFACFVISFSKDSNICLILHSSNDEKEKPILHQDNFSESILNLLPSCLNKLFALAGWSQFKNNIIDWLMELYLLPRLSDSLLLKSIFQGCMKNLMTDQNCNKILAFI